MKSFFGCSPLPPSSQWMLKWYCLLRSGFSEQLCPFSVCSLSSSLVLAVQLHNWHTNSYLTSDLELGSLWLSTLFHIFHIHYSSIQMIKWSGSFPYPTKVMCLYLIVISNLYGNISSKIIYFITEKPVLWGSSHSSAYLFTIIQNSSHN